MLYLCYVNTRLKEKFQVKSDVTTRWIKLHVTVIVGCCINSYLFIVFKSYYSMHIESCVYLKVYFSCIFVGNLYCKFILCNELIVIASLDLFEIWL